MRLELHWSPVEALTAGTATRLAEKTLAVDVDELRVLLEVDTRLVHVHLDLAHPGKLCRIARVFDVMAPRAKVGGGENFSGVLGKQMRSGGGLTRALAGVTVVVIDQQLENPGSLAFIDMFGPTATFTA